jgi:hypothetical protein
VSDRRREKELKRKQKRAREAAPASESRGAQAQANRELVARELGEPARLLVHLRRLSELLTLKEELAPARFSPEKLVPALLGLAPDAVASLPEAERGAKLRQLVVPGLADEALARHARAGFDAALKHVKTQEDQLALFAGRTFLDAWLRTRAAPNENPAWDAVFGISVLDALFEGHILAATVRESWTVDEPRAAKSFAKALARPEVASELGSLGLEERDPHALARRYAELARTRGKAYLLGFDALLHLLRANRDLAGRQVKSVLTEGAHAAFRAATREAFETSYRDDVTAGLATDFAGEVARRLKALEKSAPDVSGPRPRGAASTDEERAVALIVLASLRSLPVEENAVLRNTYLSSYEVYKNVAPVEEVPFIRRVWGDPTDRWALEEYEKFLIERRQSHRAGRVHRFLAEIRAEAKEKEEPQAKGRSAS